MSLGLRIPLVELRGPEVELPEDSGGISKEGRLLVEMVFAGFLCDDNLRFLLPGCNTKVLVEPPMCGSLSRTITSSSESERACNTAAAVLSLAGRLLPAGGRTEGHRAMVEPA